MIGTKFDISAKAAALVITLLATAGSAGIASAQSVEVLGKNEAKPLIPTSFRFEGQSAPTQMRNLGVAVIGKKRHVIVGLVDTSGYSADVAAKYEGFLITDSPTKVGGETLGTGAYGFGFTREGSINIHDIGGKTILTAQTKDDSGLKRPRPLMLMVVKGELRFYKGRTYAVVFDD